MASDLSFKAFRVTENESGEFTRSIQKVNLAPLAADEVVVKVKYSSLNYKDALSAAGNKGVTKNYPHTPGIDAVGTIENANNSSFKKGDDVIVTSYDLGMNTNGGFGEYISVPANWVLHLPKSMAMKEAMTYGTAGLTAGISVLKLSEQIKPSDGKIVVSGATGGVGSISVAILSKLGYTVVAITGKESERAYLQQLGADEIMIRSEFEALAKKPLLKPLFAGAIDTVGGVILENIIKSVHAQGVVTCCGNVASPKLELTVFPFILRGLSLIGIDSQNYPMEFREKVWAKLADEWKPEGLMDNSQLINLDQLNEKIELMLKGLLKGRTVVRHQAE